MKSRRQLMATKYACVHRCLVQVVQYFTVDVNAAVKTAKRWPFNHH